MLEGKKIIVGVSGSIAAYKSALLVRLLVKAGAEVRVVMTTSSKEFITPLTLATLSKNPVVSEFSSSDTGEWNNHVEYGLWADAFIIAPASARTLARCAQGLCDNLLTAIYLSARCPVFFAPAMDLDMYVHPSTTHNIKLLKSFGNQIIEASYGELASGLTGSGRMAEPEEILEIMEDHFKENSSLEGKKVLITAGPTNEAIDPVRFIGNHSSGKMGYAIAELMAKKGAKVTLVSGPVNLDISHPNIHLVKVTSARDMYKACMDYFPDSKITVLAAAVADYRPRVTADQKIKKKGEEMTLELVKNKDIAGELGKLKKEDQFTVGFALETENEQINAKHKLQAKNLDLIVLNSLRDKGAGFQYNTNKITLIDRQLHIKAFELKTKQEVAQDIVHAILEKI
ncbi:bifunctional phosphopantothenoylcysteine decarboxylase/phosphopantothenate--cysteine ligase CoaBC [Xanthovirga aplysinae]|uniref:bifunctional phosphopantothenoylcysteine decarboxylase/phosphopantothenate--cysteine ligase CoaBC n=1 Tax=Xanthovirga aplysinae TaxID=2529853 RepID=UPI0012BD53E3|nr:bifunctional phosphopantothenoylcysteine decarboxylase/phosphopantothenate--cysteine ligase CoaBC [Xanthovirga aplysinae]MTI31808.1 bifunctional phosphopantothenoylcysteine decarboxylase/phosphopantothenate--cysteine ligase CoaBC [Xanthovirga aplysinae]